MNQTISQIHNGPFDLSDSLLCAGSNTWHPETQEVVAVTTIFDNSPIHIDDSAIAEHFGLNKAKTEVSRDYQQPKLTT